MTVGLVLYFNIVVFFIGAGICRLFLTYGYVFFHLNTPITYSSAPSVTKKVLCLKDVNRPDISIESMGACQLIFVDMYPAKCQISLDMIAFQRRVDLCLKYKLDTIVTV